MKTLPEFIEELREESAPADGSQVGGIKTLKPIVDVGINQVLDLLQAWLDEANEGGLDKVKELVEAATLVTKEFVEMSEGQIELTPKSIQQLSKSTHEAEAALRLFA